MKPTRDEFIATLREIFPGATFVKADRGVTVIVGSEDVANRIKLIAMSFILKPTVEQEGPEDWRVRVFSFPRGGPR